MCLFRFYYASFFFVYFANFFCRIIKLEHDRSFIYFIFLEKNQQRTMKGSSLFTIFTNRNKKNQSKQSRVVYHIYMPPAIQVPDFAPVDLSSGPVLFATYSPNDSNAHHDVTQLVRQLQLSRSDLSNLQGGIHLYIGDPWPGRAKTFRCWFANRPCQSTTIASGEENNVSNNSSFGSPGTIIGFRPNQQVVAASFVGDGENYRDVSEEIRSLIAEGVTSIEASKLRRLLEGTSSPSSEPKRLKIWYA